MQTLENKDITPETAYYVYLISITNYFRFKPQSHVKQRWRRKPKQYTPDLF